MTKWGCTNLNTEKWKSYILNAQQLQNYFFFVLHLGSLLSTSFISKETCYTMSYSCFVFVCVGNTGEIIQAMNPPLISTLPFKMMEKRRKKVLRLLLAAVINQNVCHGKQLPGRSSVLISTLIAIFLHIILLVQTHSVLTGTESNYNYWNNGEHNKHLKGNLNCGSDLSLYTT